MGDLNYNIFKHYKTLIIKQCDSDTEKAWSMGQTSKTVTINV